MLVKDLLEAKKKHLLQKAGDTTPHDYNPGWEELNWLKQQAKKNGERLAGSYQLFVPRSNPSAKTPRDYRLDNLGNKWAWDDEGNLKPDYEKRERIRQELKGTETMESAPILKPGKAITPPGRNKPQADFWTSTAKKTTDGWTSEWAQWVSENQPSWFSNTGYLYKVKPGALILELDHESDAERIYFAFEMLGRATPIDYNDSYGRLSKAFPWDQIAKHFDGVRHGGYSYRSEFLYGWDVESTAWFDTSFLQLVGEVKVDRYSDNE